MKEQIYFFLRCLETAFGVMGLVLALSEYRENIIKRCVVFSAVIVALCLALSVLYVNESIVKTIWMPLLLVVLLFGMLALTVDRWQVLLFNLLSHLSVYLFISFLPATLTHILSGWLVEALYLAFRAVAFAAVIVLEVRFFRKPFRRMAQVVHREWNLAALIAGAFFCMHFLMSTYPVMYYDRPESNYILVCFTFILMLLVYWSLYIIVRYAVQRHEKEQVDALMQLRLSALERQIELQKQAEDHIRRTRHDLRHNSMVAIGKINSGDYTGAADFLRQFTDHVESHSIRQYSENHSVNCVLSALAERAQGEGICVKIKVIIPARLDAITEVELASLLANAFENAVEGCERSGAEAPSIEVSADYTDGRVLLSIKNSCGKVEFSDNLPLSTKQGGGTGTKSIQYIAEKYHGMANFEVLADMFFMQAYLFDK